MCTLLSNCCHSDMSWRFVTLKWKFGMHSLDTMQYNQPSNVLLSHRHIRWSPEDIKLGCTVCAASKDYHDEDDVSTFWTWWQTTYVLKEIIMLIRSYDRIATYHSKMYVNYTRQKWCENPRLQYKMTCQVDIKTYVLSQYRLLKCNLQFGVNKSYKSTWRVTQYV